MLKKEDLIDGEQYIGVCRNSSVAIWSAKDNCFFYIRNKFGKYFVEKINHPEDDDGFDLFIPYEKIVSRFEEEWRYDSRTASILFPKNEE